MDKTYVLAVLDRIEHLLTIGKGLSIGEALHETQELAREIRDGAFVPDRSNWKWSTEGSNTW